ncbi:glycosyl transferase [Hahella sp. CCB-MM4]|uniref:glycosyltransferase family 2 protein n=1 Tax=Hahella sp. (strain CCB-MM4) TaxID=1926491 RepID=UPI000B9ABE5A|nr:glycosyltransferase family 2 protein [Hahella sp. CCB-MM4]OZG74315.1 glycosyl transferase [Hahella sp. CCB-MM4]
MQHAAHSTFLRGLRNASGWLLYLSALGGLALLVPEEVFVPESKHFLLLIGAVGIWRYGVGLTHFVRGMIFLYLVYPYYRRKAARLGDTVIPSHVYLMVTSFRIDSRTTAMVYDSVIKEAIRTGWPTTVVCSIVEVSDEMLIRSLWQKNSPPEQVKLKFVRIPGTGKRDGLAYGFRAISRDLPDDNAIVAVVDGDTVLAPGVVTTSAPYFKLFPNMGALTTNEFCEVQGGYVMSEWHKLRFAQRHINMCSMALSNRVLTLTGRMSVFRASVVTSPLFIEDVEHDQLNHWRLGTFKFLTGDDKSSWYSLMRMGYDTWYVPDAVINTVEHPPDKNFVRASRKLMFRWYGNNLRQNSRAAKLGASKLGLFAYYVVWDQRISMWTSILGLTAAFVAAVKFSITYLLVYLLWIGLTRTVLTFLLLASGHSVGPLYPLILYYNQIFGSIMKIYVVFRLDKQSWTRQNTKLRKDSGSFHGWFNQWSSRMMTFSSVSIFLAIVFALV